MVGVSVNHPFKKNRLDAERRTHLFRVSPTQLYYAECCLDITKQ